jgi:hypothetical protein
VPFILRRRQWKRGRPLMFELAGRRFQPGRPPLPGGLEPVDRRDRAGRSWAAWSWGCPGMTCATCAGGARGAGPSSPCALAIYLLAVACCCWSPRWSSRTSRGSRTTSRCLVDTSRSQTLKVDAEGTTRLDRAPRRAPSQDGLGQLFSSPNEDHIFDVFSFDEELQALRPWPSPGPPGVKAPTKTSTKLLEALEEATRKHREARPGRGRDRPVGRDRRRQAGAAGCGRGEPLDDETRGLLAAPGGAGAYAGHRQRARGSRT